MSADISARWLALSEEIRRRLGAGTPADAAARMALERQSGLRLDSAMVHASGMGRALAGELGAEAFSIGQHVVGPQELSQSQDPAGQALLAHELTHVAASPSEQSAPGPQVQREPDYDHQETIAREVEAKTQFTPPEPMNARRPTREEVDVVTDLVYGRLVREVALEQERTGRPSAGFSMRGHRG